MDDYLFIQACKDVYLRLPIIFKVLQDDLKNEAISSNKDITELRTKFSYLNELEQTIKNVATQEIDDE